MKKTYKYLLLAFLITAVAGCTDIDNLKTDEITNNAAVIEWETGEPSDSVVLFGAYPDGQEEIVQDDSLVTFHRIKLTGLKRNTLYYYMVISCNEYEEICFFSEGPNNFTTTDVEIVSRAMKIDSLQILNEYVKPGEDIGTIVRIQNNRNDDLDDVRITIIIPELGIRKRVGPFDIDDNDAIDKEIYLTLPDDVEPGDYIIKIITTNSNQDFRRVKHRYITVI